MNFRQKKKKKMQDEAILNLNFFFADYTSTHLLFVEFFHTNSWRVEMTFRC